MRKRLLLLVGFVVLLVGGCASLRNKLLYHPTHHNQTNGLADWTHQGRRIGYARIVPNPQNVWLMVHGNGGQAADRAYALSVFSSADSVYILEYPGYGQRDGSPSRSSFDAAAAEAYSRLREDFPKVPVCVVGESIGSGPASALARQAQPPDKFVFVVPFDELTRVAADHLPHWPVGLMLGSTWDNGRALSGYRGPVEIFGAAADEVIPVYHAQALADQVPGAKFHLIPGSHNDWPDAGVTIRNP